MRNDTQLTAATPPKRLASASASIECGAGSGSIVATSDTASSSFRGFCRPPPRRPWRPEDEWGDQPILCEPLGKDDGAAEEQEAKLPHLPQFLGGNINDDRANDRTGEAFDPADHRHRDHQSHLRDVYEIGGEDTNIVAVEGAGEPGDGAGQGKGDDPAAGRIDAA